MTLCSRPRFLASLALAPLTLAVAFSMLTAAGCENKHVGRPCELAVTDDGGVTGTGTTATINPEALECPSRICIFPGQEKTTETGPLCTADCSSDDDCADAEKGPRGDINDHRCESSFACMTPTTVGDFCCRRLCVCLDFVDRPTGGFKTPAVCQSGVGSSCKNVAP